jgi:hypothetical protein
MFIYDSKFIGNTANFGSAIMLIGSVLGQIENLQVQMIGNEAHQYG